MIFIFWVLYQVCSYDLAEPQTPLFYWIKTNYQKKASQFGYNLQIGQKTAAFYIFISRFRIWFGGAGQCLLTLHKLTSNPRTVGWKRFLSCVKQNCFSSGTGSILSHVADWVSLSKLMKPRRFPEALFQSWPCALASWRRVASEYKIPSFGWSILQKAIKKATGGLGYLLSQHREVRTRGRVKSSTLATDRDSVSCSRRLQKPRCSRTASVLGRCPFSLF